MIVVVLLATWGAHLLRSYISWRTLGRPKPFGFFEKEESWKVIIQMVLDSSRDLADEEVRGASVRKLVAELRAIEREDGTEKRPDEWGWEWMIVRFVLRELRVHTGEELRRVRARLLRVALEGLEGSEEVGGLVEEKEILVEV